MFPVTVVAFSASLQIKELQLVLSEANESLRGLQEQLCQERQLRKEETENFAQKICQVSEVCLRSLSKLWVRHATNALVVLPVVGHDDVVVMVYECANKSSQPSLVAKNWIMDLFNVNICCQIDLQCHPLHTYLEVCPMVFRGVYSLLSEHRMLLLFL